MTLQTFSTSETPPASKMNSLARQAFIVCTSASRPGSPDEGMQIYETDTNHSYWFNGNVWKTHPRGLLTKSTLSTTGAGITTTRVAVNQSQLSWPGDTAERYAYELDICIGSNVGGGHATIYPQLNGSDIDIARAVPMPEANIYYSVAIRVVQTGITGTMNWQCQATVSTGSGTIQNGTDCTLTHIGDALA